MDEPHNPGGGAGRRTARPLAERTSASAAREGSETRLPFPSRPVRLFVGGVVYNERRGEWAVWRVRPPCHSHMFVPATIDGGAASSTLFVRSLDGRETELGAAGQKWGYFFAAKSPDLY